MSSMRNTSADINMNDKKLENVSSFMYLGATLSTDGTNTASVRIRIVKATTEMARLSRLWTSSSVSFHNSRLYGSSLEAPTLLCCCRDLDTIRGHIAHETGF
ncbi:hypothetical protein DPMN_036482 [Dreissena polymorpha]|uniref:Uncharacterized protein n=1 Tax=Dreissena polymorpha TaxID=45954 RepID=A0A9D4MD20_DREPO|nr:hypothetical protein DPMN_036482 [Dreissena polymorpha]